MYNTCNFRFAKMLVGVPPNPPEASGHRVQRQRGPRTSPAERVAWGEEEQGSERSFRRKAETELSGLCDDEGLGAPQQAFSQSENRKCYTLALLAKSVFTGNAAKNRNSDFAM